MELILAQFGGTGIFFYFQATNLTFTGNLSQFVPLSRPQFVHNIFSDDQIVNF
jgi:hypothetical protein